MNHSWTVYLYNSSLWWIPSVTWCNSCHYFWVIVFWSWLILCAPRGCHYPQLPNVTGSSVRNLINNTLKYSLVELCILTDSDSHVQHLFTSKNKSQSWVGFKTTNCLLLHMNASTCKLYAIQYAHATLRYHNGDHDGKLSRINTFYLSRLLCYNPILPFSCVIWGQPLNAQNSLLRHLSFILYHMPWRQYL